MRFASLPAPAGTSLLRNPAVAFPLLILFAYAVAVPPEQVFGSDQLEHVKDLFAFMFALLGLTFRALLAGAPGGRRSDNAGTAPEGIRSRGAGALVRSPVYVGNLFILVGIFLMHGDFYVVIFGIPASLALLYMTHQVAGEARSTPPAPQQTVPAPGWAEFLLRGSYGRTREWFTVAVTVGLLVLTEVYEGLPETATDSVQITLLIMSGSLMVLSALAFRFQPVSETAAVASRGPGPQTRGIRVDSRVRSVDILEDALSFGSLEAILQSTLDAADLRPGDRLLDVGCGSGKLAIAASGLFHGSGSVDALGIDATPGMIDLARERAHNQASTARFEVGVGESLPVADKSMDAVTSSYFFHHLPSDVKRQALREMWRVLAPGGRLVITDYGRARGLLGLLASFPMRFNFYEYTRPQLNGELERIIAAESLGPVEVVRVFLGYIAVFRIVKPAS